MKGRVKKAPPVPTCACGATLQPAEVSAYSGRCEDCYAWGYRDYSDANRPHPGPNRGRVYRFAMKPPRVRKSLPL